jgi:hypothetical protein
MPWLFQEQHFVDRFALSKSRCQRTLAKELQRKFSRSIGHLQIFKSSNRPGKPSLRRARSRFGEILQIHWSPPSSNFQIFKFGPFPAFIAFRQASPAYDGHVLGSERFSRSIGHPHLQIFKSSNRHNSCLHCISAGKPSIRRHVLSSERFSRSIGHLPSSNFQIVKFGPFQILSLFK